MDDNLAHDYGGLMVYTVPTRALLFRSGKKETLMLKEDDVLKAIGFAIQDPAFNIASKSENNENWDSLGALSIITALSKLTLGKSDEFPELFDSESASEIIYILRMNGLIV